MDAVLSSLSPSVQYGIPSRETDDTQSGHKDAQKPISQAILSLIRLSIDINFSHLCKQRLPFCFLPTQT